MATNSIDVKLNVLAQQAAKDLAAIDKQLGEVEKSEGEVQSAGKTMAQALSASADAIEADFKASREAADALANALGPEMAAKVGQNGLDKMVADLKGAGLTTDQIKADVGELAGAIQRLDDVGKSITVDDDLKKVGDAADTAKGHIHDVGGEADQSRSVLANMVGNSTQDIANLGGVAGTAGLALGQLGEYAADGSISLAGLAKVAGPMVAVAVVTNLISDHLAKIAASKAFEKGKVEAFTKALQDGASAAEAWDKAFSISDTGQLEFFNNFKGKVDDLTPILARNGITLKTLHDHFNEGPAAFNQWLVGMLPTEAKAHDMVKVLEFLTQAWDAQTKAMQTSADTAFVTGQQTAELHRENERLNQGLIDGSAAWKAAQKGADNAAVGVKGFRTETALAEGAYRKLTGTLDEQEGWANVNQAITDYNENTKKTDADTRNLIRSIADWVDVTDTIPESKKTEVFAILNSGDVTAIEAEMTELTRQRDIQVLIKAVGSKDTIKLLQSGGAGGTHIVVEGLAEGGIVKARPGGTLVNVAEAGHDELVVPLDGHHSFPVTSSGDTFVVHQHFPPGISPTLAADALRKYQRRGGR